LAAIPEPRSGDNPYADYAEMPLPLQRLRRSLALEADQKANDKHLGPRPGPNGDRRKLRSWLSRGAIPWARLAALLFTAELCLILESPPRGWHVEGRQVAPRFRGFPLCPERT
jgi:hypothetical protein